jgi:hypothetical protein
MAPALARLQPAFFSYLFLGLTICLMERGTSSEESKERLLPPRFQLAVLLLFAVWANVDVWFWLGPLLVALIWFGDWLQRKQHSPRLPLWLAPAGLLVCLLNPYGLKVFALPPELSPVLASTGISEDIRFRPGLLSPWQVGVHVWPIETINLAEWAYFVLLGLSVISFLMESEHLRGGRVTAWIVFAFLGAWSVRTVPFFAIVAAPITALNLQDWLRRRTSGAPRRRSLGALSVVTVGLALVLLASLGWLRGFYQQGREIGWGLWEDQSLRRAARTIHAWRERGLLGEADHAFCFHPAVADYLAWFCPGERSFVDHRVLLNWQATHDFEGTCRVLNPVLAPKQGRRIYPANGWQDVFRRHDVSYVILYDPDPQLLLPAVTHFVEDPEQWELLGVEGEAVLFGWRDAARGPKKDAFAALRFNPERLAFRSAAGAEEHPLRSAPAQGPGRPPRLRHLWEQPFRPEPPPPWESSAATVLLQVFSDREFMDAERAIPYWWSVLGTAMTGLSAQPGQGTALALTLWMRAREPELFAPPYPRSPALPLLAVRAARRGLVESPDDLNASLQLGRAYQLLQQTTLERQQNDGAGTLLGMLRHIQIATALEQILRVNPDLEKVHALLADLYEGRKFLDAALEHRQAQLRLAQRVASDKSTLALKELEERTRLLERQVLERENQYVLRSRALGNNPLARASLAVDMELAKQALDKVLLQSRDLLFGTQGAKLELELMLMLGRASQAGELLLSEEVQQAAEKLGVVEFSYTAPSGGQGRFRMPAYNWLVICQAAGVGDYGRVADALRDTLELLEQDERQSLQRFRIKLSVGVVTEFGLQTSFTAALAPRLLPELIVDWNSVLDATGVQRAGRTELHAITALLALERGEPEAAQDQFRQVLSLSGGAGHTAALARSYLPYFEESRRR